MAIEPPGDHDIANGHYYGSSLDDSPSVAATIFRHTPEEDRVNWKGASSSAASAHSLSRVFRPADFCFRAPDEAARYVIRQDAACKGRIIVCEGQTVGKIARRGFLRNRFEISLAEG